MVLSHQQGVTTGVLRHGQAGFMSDPHDLMIVFFLLSPLLQDLEATFGTDRIAGDGTGRRSKQGTIPG